MNSINDLGYLLFLLCHVIQWDQHRGETSCYVRTCVQHNIIIYCNCYIYNALKKKIKCSEGNTTLGIRIELADRRFPLYYNFNLKLCILYGYLIFVLGTIDDVRTYYCLHTLYIALL